MLYAPVTGVTMVGGAGYVSPALWPTWSVI